MSKTEALWIGENPRCELNSIGVSCHKQAITILGLFISNYMDLPIDLNLKEIIITIRSVITNWKRRNLTLIGKIVVLKTFIISQFQHVLLIHIPEKYIKEINVIMFSFLLNEKKAKIRKSILCQPRLHRGLSAPDLKLNLGELGVDFDVLFHCNFAEANVDITKLQPFYQDVLKRG